MNKNFNQREQNYINSLMLETLIAKKKSVIEELDTIKAKGKKKTDVELAKEVHLKEERRLLNGIFTKVMK